MTQHYIILCPADKRYFLFELSVPFKPNIVKGHNAETQFSLTLTSSDMVVRELLSKSLIA